jgi:hypothetical protein
VRAVLFAALLVLAGCAGTGKAPVEGGPALGVDVAGLCAKAATVLATYDAVNEATARRVGPDERVLVAAARAIRATQCEW